MVLLADEALFHFLSLVMASLARSLPTASNLRVWPSFVRSAKSLVLEEGVQLLADSPSRLASPLAPDSAFLPDLSEDEVRSALALAPAPPEQDASTSVPL